MTVLHMPHEFSPRIAYGEPMARHTSWHVDGPADIWFTPRDAADLASFLRQLPRTVTVTFVGLGSNLLVRDAGIRGAVICLHFALNSLERLGERSVRAEAGVPCARVARSCTRWGLGPAEEAVGAALRFWKLELSDLVVVHDDLELDPFRVQVKVGGGHGGNNGVKSVNAHVGSPKYARVRVGVGRPPPAMDPADYVLGRWPRASERELEDYVERATEAARLCVELGAAKAMNQVNRRQRAAD